MENIFSFNAKKYAELFGCYQTISYICTDKRKKQTQSRKEMEIVGRMIRFVDWMKDSKALSICLSVYLSICLSVYRKIDLLDFVLKKYLSSYQVDFHSEALGLLKGVDVLYGEGIHKVLRGEIIMNDS